MLTVPQPPLSVTDSLATKVNSVPGKSLLSNSEIAKLLTVESGATKNQTDAFLLARANHTGFQTISTITGLQGFLDGKIEASQKGIPNGVATLDGNGKVPLSQINDALLGAVNYRGSYNASTNTPALLLPSAANKGYYWIVSVAGTQQGFTFNVGDWIISNGAEYGRVPTSADVISVAGRKGVVTLSKNDVGLDQVNNTSDINKPISTAQQTALNGKLNLTGGTLTGALTAPNSTLNSTGFYHNGLLSIGGSGAFGGVVSSPQVPVSGNDLTNKTYVDGNFSLKNGTNSTGTWPIAITGNAPTWANQNFTESNQPATNYIMGSASGNLWTRISMASLKQGLATSLQDVTDIGSNTTNGATFGGALSAATVKSNNALGFRVSNSNGFFAGFRDDDATRTGFIQFSATNGINIQSEATTQRLLLNPSGGNVGVGTQSPAYKFVISNSDANGFEFDPTSSSGTQNLLLSYNRKTNGYTDVTLLAKSFTFGDGVSGGLPLPVTLGDPVSAGQAATKRYVDNKVITAFFNTSPITGLTAGGVTTISAPVPGALVGDPVSIGIGNNIMASSFQLILTQWVSVNGTVTIRVYNASTSAINIPSDVLIVKVFK